MATLCMASAPTSMATLCMGSAPNLKNTIPHSLLCRPKRFMCQSMTKTASDDAYVDVLPRRSANYQPSHWDHRSLLSIDSIYADEKGVMNRDLLKEKVKKMFDVEPKSRPEQLELIDDLQKLGLSYHFEQEINNVLMELFHNKERNVWKCDKEEDLHLTALEFRLLRQHGFDVSEDIFDAIVDKIKSNKFKTDDIKCIITLYEASYLSTKMDTKLLKVMRPFAIEQIRKFVDSDETCDNGMREMAIHALEMPYHWRMRRLETRWYIDEYEKKHNMNLDLIQFAKIDYNIVQTCHQEDLKYVSSCWTDTCLSKQLPFSRDRIVENFFWTAGLVSEPQYGYIRRFMTMIFALLTTIDDIYDVYGTLEELELFTTMVENWDINRLGELPEYMRLCFLVLFNEVNAIGCYVLKHKQIDVIPFLRESWADQCGRFLVEAKWFKSGYKPSLEEYMKNAWVSISASTMLIHFYCLYSEEISVESLQKFSQFQDQIIKCSSTIIRLANDLGTSPSEMARGDVLKSVQCYMHETGASEDKARAHVHQIISDTWEEMNYEVKVARSSSLLSQGFMEGAMNLTRVAQCIYQFGDGHGSPDKAKTVDRVNSLFVNPIPLH